jgi:hypothetical protein
VVGVALQVVGLILVAVGLWIVHPAAFFVLGGAGLVVAPHVLAESAPEVPDPDRPVRVR